MSLLICPERVQDCIDHSSFEEVEEGSIPLMTQAFKETLVIESDRTGLPIRAKFEPHDRVYTTDIYLLTKESLLEWLKSRDGDNAWAEDVVGILLGHGHLHPPPQTEEEG